MRSDKDLLKPEGNMQFITFKNPAWVVMLFLLGSGFIVQGCVVHTHDNRHARHKTKTYFNKNYQRHKHQDAQYQKPAPRKVKKIPFYEEQHPSHTHQPPAHAKAYDVAKGKPFTEDQHPSSHGQVHKAEKDKPHWGNDHPSSKGQDHKAKKEKPRGGNESPATKGQNHKAEKGKPLGGHESPASLAKTHQWSQGGPRQGKDHTSAQLDTPKEGESRPMMDAPHVKRPDFSPMKPGGKPDKGGPKSKGNQEDQFAASPVKESMSSESFSQPANKGESTKEDSMASPAPSGNPDIPTVESSPEPRENIQIAKAEPVRGQGQSKPSGKPSKSGKGKPNRAPEQTAALMPQEPAPAMAAPEMSTASVPPAVFDTNQRNIIQSYYQNTRSSSPSKGKGRGKASRKSKRNTTRLLAKNDIVTQPTEPLPRALESQLPPAPPNTQRAVYNQQVVLIEQGTNRVLDVIDVNH